MREELAEWRRLAGVGDGTNYGAGSTQYVALGLIAEALGELQLQLPVDAHLRDVLSRAISLLRPAASNWGMRRAATIAPVVEQRVAALSAVLDEVEAQRA